MSRTNGFRFGFVLAVACAAARPPSAHALGTAFTYQGQLQQSGVPVNGTCDFDFELHGSLAGGTRIGVTETESAVNVVNGLFTVELNEAGNFGVNAFEGSDRWLQIAVRCPAGSGSYTTLAPRQQLTATPYAFYAPEAGRADDLLCASCVESNELANGAVTSAKIAGGTIQQSNLAFTPGTVTSITAGTGLTGGTITSSGTIAANIGTAAGTVAAGNHTHASACWGLGGNGETNPGTNFLGTTDNQALELRVNNARVLSLEPKATSPNVIGGYSANSVTAGAYGATISGGGTVPTSNRVTDNYGTVGGGVGNRAGDGSGTTDDAPFATVSGGAANGADGYAATVSGGNGCRAGAENATVGGGYSNTATAASATIAGGDRNFANGQNATVSGGAENMASDIDATIGGGINNAASGPRSTVGGGYHNLASANAATVPGGADNVASGAYGFAAGAQAQATHTGSFVWSSDIATASWGDNTFTVRAPGGIRFYYDTLGNHCDLSSTSLWACASISDRAVKANVAPVDGADVLDRLATVPVQTWTYKADAASVRHMGPMAQDFHAAFRLGANDREINTVDAIGVALAAIQGLRQAVREKDATIAALAARVAALEAQEHREYPCRFRSGATVP